MELPAVSSPGAPGCRLLYVGHNAVLVASDKARILIDPYFRPAGIGDVAYRPMQPFDENPDADPFPERLVEERERRGHGPHALVLRPCDAVRVEEGAPLTRTPGFAWPFAAGR